MTLRSTIFTRCTTGGHAGLSALIGTRCYPDVVPENANAGKFVVFRLVSADNGYVRSRAGTGRTKSRVQFDCYDATGDGADALGAQVAAAWDGYSDACNVGFAFKANRTQSFVEGLNRHRQIVDIIIEHSDSI